MAQTKKKRKKRKKGGSVFWKVILVIAVTGCLVCVGVMIRYMLLQKQADLEMKDLVQEVSEERSEEREEPEPEPPAEEEIVKIPINFEELQAVNPDAYAWIRIPDTQVDYPVMQTDGEDQSYYLNHTINREEKLSGSIYTEKLNSRDFSDPNTLIYGHNMKNGSMFHDLRYFSDQEFFDEHPYIYIYMPDRMLTYEVVASYEYDDRHILYAFDFSDEEVFASYLEEVMHPRSMGAKVREGIELTTEDKLITLSTCTGVDTTRRLVQAVLVEDVKAEYDEEGSGQENE